MNMEKNNIENIRFVGLAKPQKNSITLNAMIVVWGYIDEDSNKYIPLSQNEILDVFKPKGEVFAVRYFERHPDHENMCISFYVRPKEEKYFEDPMRSDYVWTWSPGEPNIYGDEALIFPDGTISRDNNTINESFINKWSFTNKYAVCEGYLFKITHKYKDIGYIPYWPISDEFVKSNNIRKIYVRHDLPRDLLKYNENSFNYKWVVLNDNIKNQCNYADILSDAALFTMVINQAKGKYPDFDKISDKFNLKNFIGSLSDLRMPNEILNSRISKAYRLFDNMRLTKDQLDDLSTSPIFSDLVNKSIKKFSDNYIESIRIEQGELIKEIESKVTEKKSAIEESISIRKIELEKLELQITKQRNILDDILARKESIISDFQVVREVLNMGSSKEISHHDFISNIELFDNNEKLYNSFDCFVSNIDTFSLQNNIKIKSRSLSQLLTQYTTLLLPDIRMVMPIIMSTGKCFYSISYVGVHWKSFSDLWCSGLNDLVDSCYKNPDILHYLILQNINLSYLPSYYQPIVDIALGIRKKFPNSNECMPTNLHVLGIVTKEEGMPLPESCIRYFGCYPKNRIKDASDDDSGSSIIKGFLNSQMLYDNSVIGENSNSEYQTYLSDEE